MARLGLTEQDCTEVLDDLRRQCPTISDKVLVWLAETFAFEATVDFDPSDAVALLNQPGRKVISKETFPLEYTPDVALQTLLSRIESTIAADEECSGGLLICSVTRAQLSRYWPASINEVMKRFREMVGPCSDASYGVIQDERKVVGFELFIVLSISAKIDLGGPRQLSWTPQGKNTECNQATEITSTQCPDSSSLARQRIKPFIPLNLKAMLSGYSECHIFPV